jgi:amino acid transporter
LPITKATKPQATSFPSNNCLRDNTLAAMATAEKKYSGEFIRETYNGDDIQHGTVTDNSDDLQRHLGNRQIQLIAIGGSIGTALFVSIGGALNKGGPLGLLLAYSGYSCVIALVNNAMAEMATYMPVSGGFIRMVITLSPQPIGSI